MARKSNEPAVIRRLMHVLPVQLKPDEMREFGSRLARTRESVESHAVQSKQVRDELKARENELDAQMGSLAKVIRDGTELREVPVEVRMASKPGFVDEVRTDTQEVIASRQMRDDEAQTELPGLGLTALQLATGEVLS